MRLSIQIKMFFLMLGIGIIFTTGLILLKNSENNKISMLLINQKEEHDSLLNASFNLMGKNLEALVRDYSLWDEMVRFIKSPDPKWAEENIYPGLNTFNAHSIWVYSPSLSLVSSKMRNLSGIKVELPVNDPQFKELIRRQNFCHFFLPVSNSIIEIFGAPVQPSRDTLRQSPPAGYFFAGRLLDQTYLNELSVLTSSKTLIGSFPSLQEKSSGSIIVNHLRLYTWDKKLAGTIRSERNYSIINKVEAWAKVEFFSIVMFIAIVLVFSSAFLFVNVNHPLKLVSLSLQSERTGLLLKLQKRKDEFGRLSSLIIKFFRQKEELMDEIAERSRVENELRKIKNNLEDLVTERTLDLADANEKLKNEIIKIRKVEKELIIAKNNAEESDRLKTEFLAQMSHEIRSPINTILNYISLIKDASSKPLNEDMQFSFNAIDSSSRRLIRTIDMILNMSEIQTGRFECNYHVINIEKDVIQNVRNEFSSAASLKNLKLNIINNTDNPIIKGDLYTINQIFVNLVHNAIKYTNSGEINISTYKDESDNTCVDISDTGIGMSEEYLKKLFTPFSQEEQGYKRKFEGNGLGLALVKKYCELNNISIIVKSTKGAGSTFTIMFGEVENFQIN